MKRSKSNTPDGAWRSAVTRLSDQNGAIEIVPQTADGRRLPIVRARLLGVSAQDGAMVVEKPDQPQAQALQAGVEAELVVCQGALRFKARSRVLEVARFQLNPTTKVTAVKLGSPTDIESAQRRACFRLDTAAIQTQPVRLRHPSWDEDQEPVTGWLLDISDRGLGVGVAMELEEAQPMAGCLFQITVRLPGEAETLGMPGRVVRVVPGPVDGVVLGVQFEFESVGAQRRAENTVQRFSAAQQRKQLRRLRGEG